MFNVGDRVRFKDTAPGFNLGPRPYYNITEVFSPYICNGYSGKGVLTQLVKLSNGVWNVAAWLESAPIKTYTVTIEAHNGAEARQKLASGDVILTEK